MSIFDMSEISLGHQKNKKRRVISTTLPSPPPPGPVDGVPADADSAPPVDSATPVDDAISHEASAEQLAPQNREPNVSEAAEPGAATHSTLLEQRHWFSGIQLTPAEVALHKADLERYVVACLKAKAFCADDRAYCTNAAANLLTADAAAGPLSAVEVEFEQTLNAILGRHNRLFVDYCRQFAAPLAEYAAALVIRPHVAQHLQRLALHSRLRHTLTVALANAVRRQL
jgi:hypothetical protein